MNLSHVVIRCHSRCTEPHYVVIRAQYDILEKAEAQVCHLRISNTVNHILVEKSAACRYIHRQPPGAEITRENHTDAWKSCFLLNTKQKTEAICLACLKAILQPIFFSD